MFETRRPNGPAIAHFARAVVSPRANSMTADVYRLIPNSTDVGVFAARGWKLLNFAIIGNETRYHSPGDTLAALDPRSVAHMGRQALAATVELANGTPVTGSGERMYADLLGLRLVSLPLMAGLGLLALLGAAAAWTAWRRRAGLGRDLAAVGATLAGSIALVFAGQSLVGLVRRGDYWRGHPEIGFAAVDATAMAAALLALAFIGRRSSRERLRAAFWLAFLALGGATAFVAPGASIFFLAPPLLFLAGVALERRFPGAERAGALAAAALLFLTVVPLLHLAEVLLDFPAAWIFALVSALIAAPWLIELRPLVAELPRSTSAAAAAILLLGAWAAVALAPAYTQDRKQRFNIQYGWDPGVQKGQWSLTTDGAPLPPGFERFRPDVKVPWAVEPRPVADAPPDPIPAPGLEKIAERRIGGARMVRLRLSTGGAENLVIRATPGARLRSVSIAGSAARFGKGAADDSYFLRCSGRSCDGAVLDLALGSAGAVELTLIGMRGGLPAAAAPLLAARPKTAGPQYSPDLSVAVTRTRL
jgi:hypothetical protein